MVSRAGFRALGAIVSGIMASAAVAQQVSPLAGKPLRYLIGADNPGNGSGSEITEVPYGAPPVKFGISIAYCNLFDELNTGKLGPYLNTSDTAKEYHEGQIDPKGAGWNLNLNNQFTLRKRQGFQYVELDNPDAYKIDDVIRAIELADQYGLKVIAKNPGLLGRGARAYVEHPNVHGIIIEKDAGSPMPTNSLRGVAGKLDLPVWFVAFTGGRMWAEKTAAIIRQQAYREMRVTYSGRGEYVNSIDIR